MKLAEFFDQEYSLGGRLYPNEELVRFMGRHYFSLLREKRSGVRFLEMGCGNGSNLRMLSNEGFDFAGIDISAVGVQLCRVDSDSIFVEDMTSTRFEDASFDCVLDVFSSYCLDEEGFGRFVAEVARLLKPGGRFFSYEPSTGSDAFKRTGNGVPDADSPFSGNTYPFRYVGAGEYKSALERVGLSVPYLETVGRTYRNTKEYFEFVVIEGVK